jgi:hypothetical protein
VIHGTQINVILFRYTKLRFSIPLLFKTRKFYILLSEGLSCRISRNPKISLENTGRNTCTPRSRVRTSLHLLSLNSQILNSIIDICVEFRPTRIKYVCKRDRNLCTYFSEGRLSVPISWDSCRFGNFLWTTRKSFVKNLLNGLDGEI